ncbi:hypothetical protein IFR05_016762 [Cadophora sp. M221]|nr:hypothetical protein IFR05_016762 [Cadophora sp. M221]
MATCVAGVQNFDADGWKRRVSESRSAFIMGSTVRQQPNEARNTVIFENNDGYPIETHEGYPIYHLLRMKEFQALHVVRWITFVTDWYNYIFKIDKTNWHPIDSFHGTIYFLFDNINKGSALQLMLLLFVPLTQVAELFVLMDTAMIVMTILSVCFRRDRANSVLGRVRQVWWFPKVLVLHVGFIPALACITGGIWLVLTAYPITLTIAFALALLDHSKPKVLAVWKKPTPMNIFSSDPFCQICHEKIFRCRRNWSKLEDLQAEHHRSLTTLRLSAEANCRICSVVWELRKSLLRDYVRELAFWRSATTFESSHYAPNQLIIWAGHTRDKWNGTCWFKLLEKWELKERICLDGNLSSLDTNNTGSQVCLALAKNWLRTCLDNHPECSTPKKSLRTFVPTRLVEIPDDFRATGVKIIEPRALPRRRDYMTLSHCWGGLQHCVLDRTTIDEFYHTGIQFTKLPKTFQDAVIITKRLGVDFIWIDSLCIIQGDADDWKREARTMSDVYRHSICNIAASSARNSTDGCFSDRDGSKLRLTKTPEGNYIANETDVFSQYPLYTRAWVFQESFLAQRTLDFGRGQIFWRCSKYRASEVFPQGIEPSKVEEYHPAMPLHKQGYRGLKHDVIPSANLISSRPRMWSKDWFNLGDHYKAPSRSSQDGFKFWSQTVENYSVTKLTKGTDRIVALSGVASSLGSFFGEYLAGHWRTHLPIELLWRSESRTRLVYQDRAPSWSWFSTEGQISYKLCKSIFENGKLMCRVQDTTIEEVSGPNGELFLKGEIRLRGACWPAVWSGSWQSAEGVLLDKVCGKRRWLRLLGVPFAEISYATAHFDDVKHKYPPRRIFCIPIAKQLLYGWDGLFVVGLVVQATSDPCTYQRLGVFEEMRRKGWVTENRRLEDFQVPGREELIVLR